MATWFLVLCLLFATVAVVVIWVWRRKHVTPGSDPTAPFGEKPKFETTMGDLRDLRQALRPLQKSQPKD